MTRLRLVRNVLFVGLVALLFSSGPTADAAVGRDECGDYQIVNTCYGFVATYPNSQVCEQIHPTCCQEFCASLPAPVYDDSSISDPEYCGAGVAWCECDLICTG
jgi:hypothetical protein